jgi:putative inorganic carbon (hco3(-)) transporter
MMKSPFAVVREYMKDVQYTTMDKLLILCLHIDALLIILSIALAQILSYVIIILAIIQFIKEPRRIKTPFDIPLLLFILIRIVSVFFSVDGVISMRTLHTEIPYYVLFYAVSQQKAFTQVRLMQSLLWMFILSAVIGSCYGIISVFSGHQARAESFTSGYYTLGSFLTIILAILLVLGKSKMFEMKRWLWYALIMIVSTGLILTLNRIHWGIMIVLLIGTGIVQEKKLLGAVIVLFGCLLLLSPSVSRRLDQAIHFSENLSDRDILWKGASMIWLNHPILGYGPGTFKEIFPIRNELNDVKIGGWHNDGIQLVIESGLLGLMSFLLLIYTMYRKVFIKLRNMKSDDEKIKILLALLVGMSTILFSSLTGSGFLDMLIRIMFVFLLAMIALLIQTEGNSSDTAE